MAEGVKIGRGYISVHLDDEEARAALEKFKQDAEKGLGELDKKRKPQVETEDARKKIDKLADDIQGGMLKAARTIGLAGSALSALGIATLGVESAASGLMTVAQSLVTALGGTLVLPAVFAAAATGLVAMTVGMHGFAAALKAEASGNAQQISKAMADLSPNARSAVLALESLGKQWTALRLDVQQHLFEGINKQIKDLGTAYIPVLRTGLVGVATQINAGTRAFGDMLKSAQSVGDTKTIFANITTAMQRLVPSGAAFGAALRDITTVGSTFLPRMAGALDTVAIKFGNLVSQARQSGALDRVIGNGLQTLDDFGASLVNFGKGMAAVFRAGQQEGAGLSGTLRVLTQDFATWAKSYTGQDALTSFFASARSASEALVPTLRSAATVIGKDIAPTLASLGRIAAPALDALVQGIGILVARARPGLDAFIKGFADLVTAIAHGGDAIGRFVSAAGTVLGPALSAIARVITAVVVPAINAVAAIMERTSGVLTVLVLGLVAAPMAWKALSAGIDLVSGALKKLAPSAISEALSGIPTAVEKVAAKAGDLTEGLTGSYKAADKVYESTNKVGSVMQKVGGILPIVGVGAVALGIAFELASQHAKQLSDEAQKVGQGLVVGGQAAQEAAKKLEDYQRQVDEAKRKLDQLSHSNTGTTMAVNIGSDQGQAMAAQQQLDEAKGQLRDAQKAADDYRASLSPLQLAQAVAEQRQKEYNQALAKFGETSPETQRALLALRDATTQVETAQQQAAQATRSHDQALKELADQALAAMNADANLKLSLVDLSDAQHAAADAVKRHGAESDEATRANSQYELQLARVIQATRDKAMADNAAKTPADQLAAANQAVAQQILGLTVAAGDNAPPALLAMAAKMYDSQQAAITATIATGNFKSAVLALPDGRTVTIAVDDQGRPVIDAVAAALAALPRNVQIGIHAVYDEQRNVTGPAYAGVPRATGGPINPGTAYLVGEHGPELILPERHGYVVPSAQTRALRASADRGGTGGGGVFTGTLMLDSGELMGVVRGEIQQSQSDMATAVSNRRRY